MMWQESLNSAWPAEFPFSKLELCVFFLIRCDKKRETRSFKSNLGVSKNRGTPKWMVKIKENPIKMVMIWGYHYFRKHPFKQLFHQSFLVHSFVIIPLRFGRAISWKKELISRFKASAALLRTKNGEKLHLEINPTNQIQPLGHLTVLKVCNNHRPWFFGDVFPQFLQRTFFSPWLFPWKHA